MEIDLEFLTNACTATKAVSSNHSERLDDHKTHTVKKIQSLRSLPTITAKKTQTYLLLLLQAAAGHDIHIHTYIYIYLSQPITGSKKNNNNYFLH